MSYFINNTWVFHKILLCFRWKMAWYKKNYCVWFFFLMEKCFTTENDESEVIFFKARGFFGINAFSCFCQCDLPAYLHHHLWSVFLGPNQQWNVEMYRVMKFDKYEDVKQILKVRGWASSAYIRNLFLLFLLTVQYPVLTSSYGSNC